MCEFAYMKLYPADLLGDTEDLTAADFGSYMLLLISMWRKGGKLRLEHGGLARIARRSSRHWMEIWGRLAGFFRVSEDGLWITQKRLDAELDDARQRRAKASAAASAREAAKRDDLGKMPGSEPGKMPASPPRKSLENNNPPTTQDTTPEDLSRVRASQSASKKESNTVEIGEAGTGTPASHNQGSPAARHYSPGELRNLERRFPAVADIERRVSALVLWAEKQQPPMRANELKIAVHRRLEKDAGELLLKRWREETIAA